MTQLYNSTHKQWDHVGHIVPEVEQGESQYPHFDSKPAAWLPVNRYDNKVEEYMVVTAGKVIALDKQGRVVPAGLKLSFEAAGGSTVLSYVAADVSSGTIDLTTGASVLAPADYTQTQVTTALRNQCLIGASEFARDFISDPVGYARYSYFQWCGGDGWNPALFRRHNHSLQSQVAIGCDKVLQAPLVPAVETAETQGGGVAIADTAIAFGTGAWKSSAGIASTARYASEVTNSDSVVAMVFEKAPVAKIFLNTPITDSAGTLTGMTEVDSIAAVIAGGSSYFFIDYEAGVMFLYELGGNAIPTGFDTANTITYYTYEDAATGTADILQALGNLQSGDFVTFDANSNFVKWAPAISTATGGASGAAYTTDPDYGSGTDSDISDQLESFVKEAQTRCIGQVLDIIEGPMSGLEKVMTQFTSLGNVERMPGTATEGLTDAQVQAGASNKMVIINFLNR